MDPIEQNDLPPDGEQDKPDESDSHKALIAAILLALLGFQRDYLLLYFPPEGNDRPDLSPYAPSGPNGSPSRGPSSPNPHRPPSGQPSPHAPTLSTDSLKSDSQRIADWMAREISDTLQKRAAAAAAKARLDGLDEEGIKDSIKKVVESDALADVWANALATTLLGAASLDTAEQIGIGTMTWTTQRDNRVRDTHREMDGQQRAPGEEFESPSGATALHPGGFGDWSEDANCRCQLIPSDGQHDATWHRFEQIRADAVPGLKDAVRELMNSHLDDLMNMTNIQAMRFDLSAMAIALPDESHPNRLPFSGVLTKVGEPSDNPPDGANGRRVLIPPDVAEKALDSLAAMGVDFTADYSGHDPTQKIGVITAAEIEGNDLTISGFFYAQDFPDEVAFIQANKDRLGFSYEAQVMVEDQNANPLTVSHCVFTGAAVLFKDKAAYTTTSLQASKDSTKMDEQLKAALEAITQSVAGLAAEVATIKASATVQAGSVLHKVKPHSDALRACADKLEADGIGADPKRGHVAVLRHMADSMEASACTGNLPSIYTGGDFYYASAEVKADPKVAELEKTVADLSAKLEAAATVAADAKKAAFNAASAPDRKTVSPVIAALLQKGGITLEASGDNKLSEEQIDAVIKASGATTPAQRMAKKLELQAAGLL